MRFTFAATCLALTSSALALHGDHKQRMNKRQVALSSTSTASSASSSSAIAKAAPTPPAGAAAVASASSLSSVKPTSSAVAPPPAAGAVNDINAIFTQLTQDVTPPLKAIQDIINADPNITAETLRADPVYTEALTDLTTAFETAVESAKALQSAPAALRRLLARQSATGLSGEQLQQISQTALQAVAGLVNNAQTTLASVPIAGDIAADIFNAVNAPISQLLGVVNTLLGAVTGLAGDLLGNLLDPVLGNGGLLGGLLGSGQGLLGGLTGGLLRR